MATKNFLDYTGLSTYHSLIKQYIGESQSQIFIDTTANWEKQTSLVSIRGALYIYSDYQTEDGTDIPGIKVGDGLAYVVDLPFTDVKYSEHLADTVSHITSAERTAWNNKVSVVINGTAPETLVFTTN